MKTYFLSFDILPGKSAKHLSHVDHAWADCWVVAADEMSAIVQSQHNIARYEWIVGKMKQKPIIVEINDFEEMELETEYYKKAQKLGISIAFHAIAKPGVLIHQEAQQLPHPDSFDLAKNIKKRKDRANKGRCLHYEAGEQCNEFINAHSIQNNGALSLIAKNSEVYVISDNYNDLRKNHGLLSFRKKSVRKTSVFKGFCKEHDNKLFAPIDDTPLLPTNEQVFLYAYRSLCREVFVKTNALQNYSETLDSFNGSTATKELIENHIIGTEHGLNNLLIEKGAYDKSLKKKTFQDIEYVLFHSSTKPNIVFSGGIFPDVGFNGEQLQSFLDFNSKLSYITFCFAPTYEGWGFLLAWHKESSTTCVPFIQTIKLSFKNGNTLEDMMFRLLMTSCENLAFSPEWYESLKDGERLTLNEFATYGVSFAAIPRHDYLKSGLENFINWKFDHVQEEVDYDFLK